MSKEINNLKNLWQGINFEQMTLYSEKEMKQHFIDNQSCILTDNIQHELKQQLTKTLLSLTLCIVFFVVFLFLKDNIENIVCKEIFLFDFIFISPFFLGVPIYYLLTFHLIKDIVNSYSEQPKRRITKIKNKSRKYLFILLSFLFISSLSILLFFFENKYIGDSNMFIEFSFLYTKFSFIGRVLCYTVISAIIPSLLVYTLYNTYIGAYIKKIDFLYKQLNE